MWQLVKSFCAQTCLHSYRIFWALEVNFFSDIHFCYTLHKDTASTPEIVCCRVPRHCCELLIRRHFQEADAEHRIRCNLCNRSRSREWQEFSFHFFHAWEITSYFSSPNTRKIFRSRLKDFHSNCSWKSDLHLRNLYIDTKIGPMAICLISKHLEKSEYNMFYMFRDWGGRQRGDCSRILVGANQR